MGVMGDVVKHSFPWQVGKQKQKIKALMHHISYDSWLMRKEKDG